MAPTVLVQQCFVMLWRDELRPLPPLDGRDTGELALLRTPLRHRRSGWQRQWYGATARVCGCEEAAPCNCTLLVHTGGHLR